MTPELTKFFADLPPHIKPANDTERLKMTFAWLEGHTEGMKMTAKYSEDSLMRLIPEKSYDVDDINDDHLYVHEPDAKSASDSIDRENAASINRSNNRER